MKLWFRYVFMYELNKRKEKAILWFVWKLPKWLVYWCAIRLGSHATTGDHSNQNTSELLFIDALKRWEPKS